jgi:hypothetical protein
LSELDRLTGIAEKTTQRVIEYGGDMLEQLGVTEYNCQVCACVCSVHARAQGHEVTRDYLAGVVHVRQAIVDATTRRRRNAQLLDVRRLKLQQLQQLFQCEDDCMQVWSGCSISLLR